jgi:hypothetical protein
MRDKDLKRSSENGMVFKRHKEMNGAAAVGTHRLAHWNSRLRQKANYSDTTKLKPV